MYDFTLFYSMILLKLTKQVYFLRSSSLTFLSLLLSKMYTNNASGKQCGKMTTCDKLLQNNALFKNFLVAEITALNGLFGLLV